MIGVAPSLTTAGDDLFIRAASGEAIEFTRFKIGNGTLPTGSTGKNLTDLINPVVSFGISSVEISSADENNERYLTINGHFDSTDIDSDFQLRELGVFCRGEDSVEKLYCYANDGDNAGIMKANESDVSSEHDITVVVAIGEAEHVTAVISAGTLYAPKADFDAHVADTSNPHSVTKKQVGLGNVPNVTTNNQTPTYSVASSLANLASGEKLSTAFGKISKAISAIIDHINNKQNPHDVTWARIGAAKSVHNHAASDITSGILPAERGGTGYSKLADAAEDFFTKALSYNNKYGKSLTNIDWNNLKTPGLYYVFYGCPHHPPKDTNYYVLVVEFTQYPHQIAFSDDIEECEIYRRNEYYSNGEHWGEWS